MINKKLLATVLAAALTCTNLPIQGIGTVNVFAQEESVSDFTIDENGVLTKYNGKGGDVVIPDGVTSIGKSALWFCDSLTSVTIPEGVTKIGSEAFCGCSNLTSITIPDSVTMIEKSAFRDCSSLTSITIPKGVTVIEESVFLRCSSLTSITIPDSVTEIGYIAFRDCSSLTSITIPDSVTEIGYIAFEGCSSLISITVDNENNTYDSRENCNAIIETKTNTLIAGCQNTIIPENVTEIGECAFLNCKSLTSITIPKSVTEIGELAFNGCTSLTSITVDSDNNTYDSRESCNAIIETETNTLIAGCQNTIIPKGVTAIGDMAFGDCISLTRITIPDNVTEIDYSAFEGCINLTNITIPESVIKIGRWAFKDTKWLNDKQTENPIVIVNHIVIDGSACDGDVEIPEGVTSIGDSAFLRCSSLASVTIPEGVTAIGDEAFCDCSSLTSIILPEGVTVIGDEAFKDCSSLTNVTIPKSVTSIKRNAFIGTKWFEDKQTENPIVIANHIVIDGSACNGDIEIPEGITVICDGAFYDCNSLTSIIIPEDVTVIGEWAFPFDTTIKGKKGSYAEKYAKENRYEFEAIDDIKPEFDIDEAGVLLKYNGNSEDVVIPENVKEIGDSAFEGCSMASVTIPEGVTKIGEYAFANCSALTNVTIPDSVTEIGGFAFLGTKWLEDRQKENPIVTLNDIVIDGSSCVGDVEIPEGVKEIGSYAFFLCDESLVSVIIPEGVTKIGNLAFADCSGLTNITIPESVTEIGDNAFLESGLTTIKGKKGSYAEEYAKENGYEFEAIKPEFDIDENGVLLKYNGNSEDIVIPENVKEIGDSAFEGCSMASVTIPEGVTKIGEYAFANCSSLTNVTIPDSVTEIGGFAFLGTKWLEVRQKENPIVTLNDIVIDGSSCVGDVEIPEDVKEIGSYAFFLCDESLVSVIIPEGVTKIGSFAFASCSGLTNITIPESVTEIGDNAFLESGLTTIKGKKGSYAENYAKENGYEFEAINDVIIGDLDGDGNVNLNDAKMLLRAAVGIIRLTDEQKKAADINDDGQINLNDAKMLLRAAVGIIKL